MRLPYYVADAEADGLLDTVTKLHCVVCKDVETRKVFRFYDGPPIPIQYPNTEDHELVAFPRFAETAILVMHNGIDYDRRMFIKTINFDIPIQQYVDTLKLSKMLYPDIKVPQGWKGKAAPHSVEAWGMRFGRPKPEHDDWSIFTPEMLHRCEEDTEIQFLMYMKFLDKMKEMNHV